METRQLPVTVMVELTAPEGETLRRTGTIGTTGNKRCVIAASDLHNWESVPEGVVLAAIEEERLEQDYRTEVVRRIRLRYTADDEAAILRKRLAVIDSGEESEAILNEFLEYNSYAEQCKAEARAAVYPQHPETEQPEEVEPETEQPEIIEVAASDNESQESQESQESHNNLNDQNNEED